MEKLKKGYCFEEMDGNRFVIIGEAVSRGSGQPVYLCQELTGELRLMIWNAGEILKAKETGASKDFRKESFSDFGKPHIKSYTANEAQKTEDKEAEYTEEQLQNMMIRFLEASSCSEKLELLDLMKEKATDSMLESMAISMDYELGGGSVEEKYYALERFLKTRKRYEGTRLR